MTSDETIGLRSSERVLPVDHAAALVAAGLFFVAEGALFMTAIMMGASIVPDYDLHGGAISDLGSIAETALLFNGSLIAVGLFTAIGALLVSRAARTPAFLFLSLVAALGAAGAAVFTLGDAPGLHSLFALAAFVGFNLMPTAIAFRLGKPMAILSALASIVGLAYVVVMVIGDAGQPAVFGPIGHGGAERMIAYPPMFWLLAFGGYLAGGGVVRRVVRSEPSIDAVNSRGGRGSSAAR
jgi:hypothetical membrane protein